MNLKIYFNGLKKSIDKALDKVLPSGTEEPQALHRAMRYSVFSSGKRLRPIIAIECAKACGGSINGAMPAACAVELIHTYSLIHDDLPSMDNDDYRRGRPSCHKAFGEANAILAGDALVAAAFNVIAGRYLPDAGMAMIKILSGAIGSKGMVGGQALDIEHEGKNKDRKTSLHINCLKTARLFEAASEIGAMAASAAEKKIAAIGRYGASLGAAFQIVDDITDRADYSKIFGASAARKDAEDRIKTAKKHLKIFGGSAATLLKIADFVITS